MALASNIRRGIYAQFSPWGRTVACSDNLLITPIELLLFLYHQSLHEYQEANPDKTHRPPKQLQKRDQVS